MAYVNDSKPSGSSTGEDIPYLFNWDDSVATWDSSTVTWDSAPIYTLDTEPTGSYSNDSKPV